MSEQLLISLVALAVGILGWVLPYRWNILRPKRLLARFIPESARPVVPKVLGTLFVLFGLLGVVASAFFPDATEQPTSGIAVDTTSSEPVPPGE